MRLFRDLINMGLISTIGNPGSSNTPIGRWFRFLAHIELTGFHSEARDIIEGYVEELAEIARKYIPEDIPLCVLVSEYSSPPTPDILYRTPLENTNTTSPDYSKTSQSSQLSSLIWVTPIIVIITTLAALYVIKRSSLASMYFYFLLNFTFYSI